MVIRIFTAFDSDALTVDGSSPTLTPGSSVINNSPTADGTIFTYNGGFAAEIQLDDTDTGGNEDVFNDDSTATHTITDGNGLVANGQSVEAESIMVFQQIDVAGNPVGDPITVTVFSQGGVTGDVWGFATSAPMVAGARYEKVSGNNIGSSR